MRDAGSSVTAMSDAERARAYRRRKKAREAAAVPVSGVQADGSWEPVFEGQREPFTAGNTAAVVHGADSGRQVVPLAGQIVERYLGGGECPEYLKAPHFLPTVEAWARLQARAALLDDWLAGMSAEEMTMPRKAGGSSPVEIWLAAERAAGRARERLGLDPVAWAKLARDLGIAGRAADDALSRLAEGGRQIRERRESAFKVIEGGGDGQPA
jgi:hypothetical protein